MCFQLDLPLTISDQNKRPRGLNADVLFAVIITGLCVKSDAK